MKLAYETLTIGPMGNNVYFLYDKENLDCVIIDPTFLPRTQLEFIEQRRWNLRQIWLTHGHFDHSAGVKGISGAFGLRFLSRWALRALNGQEKILQTKSMESR